MSLLRRIPDSAASELSRDHLTQMMRRQFLTSSGLPTKWSQKSKPISTRELAKIAKRQTVMVMCHR